MSELQVISPQPNALELPARHGGIDLPALYRIAAEQGEKGVQILERLMVIDEKIKADQAKAAFNAALAAFQSECPIIVKRKAGAQNAYKYAPLDDIVSQVKDLLQKHGFSFSLTSDIVEGWVLAKCKVTHQRAETETSHSEVSEFKCPIDLKNPMMTSPQRYGGAMTFAKRYAFCNAFGILTADEDSDGHADRPKPRGPSNREPERTAPAPTSPPPAANQDAPNKRKLIDLTRSVHRVTTGYTLSETALDNLEQWLVDETLINDNERLPELSGARLAEVIGKIERKLKP